MTTPRVVVVTGASRGIGRAIAIAFASQSWHVVANYRRERAEAETTASMIAAQGGSIELRQADITDPTQAAALFAGLDRLDALINNAGVTRDAPMPTMLHADWRTVLDTNLGGVFHCTRAAVPIMTKAGHGAIVTIGSSAAASARTGQANYASAKSGLLGFTRSLGRELAPLGIRVLMVAPGYTATDMARAVPDATSAEALRRIPLARWARPEEVATAVTFFASDAASAFAGQTIMVDGGRTVFETELGL